LIGLIPPENGILLFNDFAPRKTNGAGKSRAVKIG